MFLGEDLGLNSLLSSDLSSWQLCIVIRGSTLFADLSIFTFHLDGGFVGLQPQRGAPFHDHPESVDIILSRNKPITRSQWAMAQC